MPRGVRKKKADPQYEHDERNEDRHPIDDVPKSHVLHELTLYDHGHLDWAGTGSRTFGNACQSSDETFSALSTPIAVTEGASIEFDFPFFEDIRCRRRRHI